MRRGDQILDALDQAREEPVAGTTLDGRAPIDAIAQLSGLRPFEIENVLPGMVASGDVLEEPGGYFYRPTTIGGRG